MKNYVKRKKPEESDEVEESEIDFEEGSIEDLNNLEDDDDDDFYEDSDF